MAQIFVRNSVHDIPNVGEVDSIFLIRFSSRG